MRKRIILWWLSYLIVLVIPLMFSVVIYNRVTDSMNRSINQNQETALVQIRLAIDGMVESAINISNDLSINGNVKSLTYEQELMEPRKKIALLNIQKSLSNYQVTNDKVDDIYIYFESMDSVLATKMLYRNKSFDTLSDDLLVDRNKLIESMKASKKFMFSRGNKNGSLFYFQNISLTTKPHRIIAFFQIDYLESFLRELTGDTGTQIYIIGNDDEYLSSSAYGNELPFFLQHASLRDRETIFSEVWEENELVISHIPSNILDINYVIVSPKEVYLSDLMNIQLVMATTLLICFIVVSSVAYIFARKNYSPVKRMLTFYRNQLGNSKESGNEFQYLEGRLKELLNDNEFAKSTIHDQKEQMRKSSLKELLRNSNLGVKDIKLKIGSFYIFIFKVKDSGDCLSMESGLASNQAEELTSFVISNVMNELLNLTMTAETITMDGVVVCICSIPGAKEESYSAHFELPETILEKVEEGKLFLRENFQMSIYAAVSKPYTGVEELYQAYRDAFEKLEYQQLIGDEVNIGISQEQETAEKTISAAERRKFNNLLLSGELEGAKNAVVSLIDQSFAPKGRLVKAQLKLFMIKEMLITGLSNLKDGQGYDYSVEERIFHCKSVRELREEVISLFDEIQRCEEKETSHKDRISAMLSYLEEHISDSCINVSMLADRFMLDRYYATKEVKRRTGYSLLDYIHKLRLDKAKLLLLQNKLTIAQIAEECGFTNTVALNRVFQKYEGIAAGKYRRIAMSK